MLFAERGICAAAHSAVHCDDDLLPPHSGPPHGHLRQLPAKLVKLRYRATAVPSTKHIYPTLLYTRHSILLCFNSDYSSNFTPHCMYHTLRKHRAMSVRKGFDV